MNDSTELASGGSASGESAPEQAETPSPEPIHPQPATPLAEKKSPVSELSMRLVTAAILIPFVLYVIYLGGWLYLAVVATFGVLAQREFYGLIEDKGAEPLVMPGLGFGLAVMLIAYWGNEYHTMLLVTASLLVFMIAQLGKPEITEALASISGTFFGVFYVAWLLSHAIVLRFFYKTALGRYGAQDLEQFGLVPDSGAFFMTYVLAVVAACDAGAYFAGRAYGRRKLAPKISPNKTVEGALGGLLAALVVGVSCKLVYGVVAPELAAAFSWSLVLGFAPILAAVGIVGDLVESLLKRDAKVKDTGALLPGMGGILDRIDAPLLAIPVMYYMLLAWVEFNLG
ncbi:MAG: phosphatidate cytidylyltransferase [Myxococcales bacterium]|nr:phosphatidate cytidylyltransferase [Myxococcales bacterium]